MTKLTLFGEPPPTQSNFKVAAAPILDFKPPPTQSNIKVATAPIPNFKVDVAPRQFNIVLGGWGATVNLNFVGGCST